MSLFHCHAWYRQILELDLKTSLPRTFGFASSDKVEELILRGGGHAGSGGPAGG
jgi:hypothetical protein